MEGVARQCAGNSRSVQLQSQIDCEREVDPGSRGNIPVESDRIQARRGDGKVTASGCVGDAGPDSGGVLVK